MHAGGQAAGWRGDSATRQTRNEQSSSSRRAAAKLLTRDAARRIAANIAKLPELLAEELNHKL